MSASRILPGVLTLLALGACLALSWMAEVIIVEQARRHEREHVADQLDALRLRIEKLVARDIYSIRGLATYVEARPGLDADEFDAFAARLVDADSAIRHVAAAPDLVIRYVYPREGNEAALGFAYHDDALQQAAAERAARSDDIVVAGPLELVQGGSAFVARTAVWTHDAAGAARLWGLVAVIIDSGRFYAAAGLLDDAAPLEVALRGRDATGAEGPAFFGDASLFEQDVVTGFAALPVGGWQIAARPRQGWTAAHAAPVWLPRAFGAGAMVLVVAFAAFHDRFRRDRAAADRAVHESQTDFRLLFENVNDAIFIRDTPSGRVIDANVQAARYLGYPREALIGMCVSDIYATGDDGELERITARIKNHGSAVFQARHRRADGSLATVEVSARRVQRPASDVIISVVRDVTERESAAAALRRSQQDLVNSIESISEGFALWDRDDCLQVYNRRMLELSPHLEPCLAVGVRFVDMVAYTYDQGIVSHEMPREDWIAARLRQHREPGEPLEILSETGRYLRISEHRTPDGYIVGIYTDITAIKQAEEHIRYRAYFDMLTDLPNRENFMSQLEATVRLAQRNRTLSALLFVDLDRFKNVNDTLGHQTGDLLLQEAARRICHSVRNSDIVARFGGDEFAVILRDIAETNDAARIAETIIGRLAEGYVLDEQVLYCGASIGITVCPSDSVEPEVLLRNADMAMYQAKALGRNTFRFFTASMTARAEQFVALEKDLRRSIGSDEFELHYQPVIRLDDGALGGAEALLRWHHPERGTVSPAEFIPVAEETRLIVELGAWVLERACREMLEWVGPNGALPHLALNVSSRQLWGGFDGDFVRGVLNATGFPGEHLKFEMTESLLIEDDERASAILGDFRDLGIGISIDDFGTGYSALGYLRRFPVTTLKIDRSFVRDIEVDRSDASLVESIIAMARALGIDVVAEGVETAGQAAMLRAMGCQYAQGFLFGRPQPRARFAADFVTTTDRRAGG
ncbi:MAG: EAL domain-containing protein [Gammaproteobacteria bacterium]|nr:EAL domain-containing protein [Gammaproteobacteria bacterium]MCP5198428.1 EAL domain-containing protein [Gammaproteobacteria bacterium]